MAERQSAAKTVGTYPAGVNPMRTPARVSDRPRRECEHSVTSSTDLDRSANDTLENTSVSFQLGLEDDEHTAVLDFVFVSGRR